MLETTTKGEIFGCHSFSGGVGTNSLLLKINNYTLLVTTEGKNDKTRDCIFRCSRIRGNATIMEKLLTSGTDTVILCILPVPPLYASRNVSDHLCLRFKSPLVVDPDQKLDLYTKIPIEVGIFKQSHGKQNLLIDCISLCKQQYTLYGTPERGLICRYKETEIYATEGENSKFEEASLRVLILNETDRIIQISKLIIPMSTMVIDYSDENAYVSGRVEIRVGTSLGKDVANVQLISAKVWDSESSTVKPMEKTLTFLMDKGF
jgi:hypothetical protein